MKSRFSIFQTPVAMLFVLAFFVGSAHGEVPFFRGDALPLPPLQNAQWNPPANVPDDLLEVTRVLYEHGLADPRGCEYREFTIRINAFRDKEGWFVYSSTSRGAGGDESRLVHGWLLPGENSANRFAICWNGLVYPVLKLLGPADLQADLNKRLDHGDDRRRTSVYFDALSEHQSVAIPPVAFQAPCLLLRLGMRDEATKIWDAFRTAASKEDPVVLVASHWLWAITIRALNAHLSGDDNLALADARFLNEIGPKLEALMFARPGHDAKAREHLAFNLNFRALWPLLLADQENRARKRNTAPPADKIAALVANLENAHTLSDEPWREAQFEKEEIVQELIAQGEEAVPALLETIENDHRLTRSVAFDRYDFAQRRAYTVAEAAYFALRAILKGYSFGDEKQLQKPDTRATLVTRARAFWAQYKDLKNAERSYFLLQDDRAGSAQWLQAAQNITRASDAVFRGGAWVIDPRPAGTIVKMSGEALRAKQNPSVNDLIIRRIKEGVAQAEKTKLKFVDFVPLRLAGELALELYDWDEKAATPVLESYFHRAAQLLNHPTPALEKYLEQLKKFHNPNEPNSTVQVHNQCAALMPRVFQARLRHDEKAACEDYAAWLREVGSSLPVAAGVGEINYLDDILLPLCWYPEHTGLNQAALALFEGKNSFLNPWLLSSDEHWDIPPFNGVTITIPAFRRMVLRQLQDTKTIGEFRDYNGWHWVKFNWELKTYGGYRNTRPKQIIDLRMCDLYAYCLSQLEGAPEFKVTWPIAQRNGAIKAAQSYLNRFGARFSLSDSYDWGYYPISMKFPILKRPATPQEAAQGKAIFAFSDKAETRVADLKLPRRAVLKRNGKAIHGTLWQAEEILQNGQWQRFYGFVGWHLIGRVSAAEIELTSEK